MATTSITSAHVTGELTSPGLAARLADRLVSAAWGLPPASGYTVGLGVRVPMRDGVELVADHYAPVGAPALGTVLIRGPYGRAGINNLLWARVFAARGYHVLLQSCRGTFGSGGVFQPMLREIDDGQDTVAWLREQEWFNGRLATAGGSYLGFTQWALLTDPPPELRTAVISVAPHDFNRATSAGGAFSLGGFLDWSEMISNLEGSGPVRELVRGVTRARRLRPGFDGLPLVEAGEAVLNGRAPWYREWASRDRNDPYWERVQLDVALDRVQVPLMLVGGFHDLFADQTLEQYVRLHRRGIDVALTMGAWTHMDLVQKAAAMVTRETLDWLGEHVAGRPGRRRPAPVRIEVTGADGGWRGIPEWPPPAADHVLYLTPDGVLGPAGGWKAGTTEFTYDPTDPTPAVGGRVFNAAGSRDNRALEARPDVRTFTGVPLAADLEVVGVPVVELAHRSDNPHADLFVRICDVDPNGSSRNLSDGLVRLETADEAGVVRVEMDALAHRFPAGHRIRLQVSGGAHPRFARNLGTGEPPASGTRTRPSHRTLDLDGRSRVTLPTGAS